MAIDFKKKLAAAKANWKKATKRVKENEGKGGFKDYDDGRYLARLTNAELGESQNGRTQVVFDWKFAEGEYEDDTKKDYQGLDSEDNLYFFGRRIEQLGYEVPDDVTEILDVLKALSKDKPLCKIRLKTKGDFQNVYVDKVFDKDEEEEVLESAEDEEEDADAEEAEEVEEEEAEEEEAEEEEAEEEEEEEEAEEEEEVEEEEEPEEEDDVDEEADLQAGMKVIASTKDGDQKGEVLEVLEKEGKARLRLESGKVVRIGFDKLAIDDTPPEKPAKGKKTKAAAEPPAKTKGKTTKKR